MGGIRNLLAGTVALAFSLVVASAAVAQDEAAAAEQPVLEDPVGGAEETPPPAEPSPADEAPPADEDEAFLGEPTESPAEEEAATEGEPSGEPKAEAEGAGGDEEWEAYKKRRDHFFQGFVNVLAGSGWYMVAPYGGGKDDPTKACGPLKESKNINEEFEGEPVCTGWSALHMDFLGGFAPLPGFEVFAMFRLGLMPLNEYSGNPRAVGAGVKVYTPDDGLFKIGFGVAPLFDFSDRRGLDLGRDFVIHVPIELHFDFVRWVGAYAQVAPNVSFLTEFKLDITAGIGVQGRFI